MKFASFPAMVFCIAVVTLPVAESSAQTPSQVFLCDSVSATAPAELIVAAYQQRSCLEELSDIDDAKKLVQLLNLDVLAYYDLNGVYDLESKKNEYRQTKEFKDKQAEMATLKSEKLKNVFYSTLTTVLGKFRWDIKGFKFEMEKLSTPGGLTGAPPPPQTILYSIELSSIPFAIENETDQVITLKVDPDNGMTIDKNKDSLNIIVLYKLGSVKAKEYTYFNAQCHCNRKAKQDVITTVMDRVIIFNSNRNEVYLDEKFK